MKWFIVFSNCKAFLSRRAWPRAREKEQTRKNRTAVFDGFDQPCRCLYLSATTVWSRGAQGQRTGTTVGQTRVHISKQINKRVGCAMHYSFVSTALPGILLASRTCLFWRIGSGGQWRWSCFTPAFVVRGRWSPLGWHACYLSLMGRGAEGGGVAHDVSFFTAC